ncbi:hypothetical protein MGYG_01221 [Nannizzia gypsea CBS 118893]|uniref:Uncharacterized protein n=1 Tax=Arthroderma gypseum (strain ATCC MYA-4604 / CBS 118893) TaxID=535722 RepID=E5QZN4_ARTGP|nr:hypothetical protein MGYG_01221 [Nannizzia gypsea CBS 118893]EFQ98185.1 hypothetical protein MGYG_01221 [Nannizzia gypsea CBS 118893]
MTTTPPPSSAIRPPPTPRYGSRYDNYEPYSPRRSKRIADQQHLFNDSAAAPDASTADLIKEHTLRRDQELHQLGVSGRATYSPPHSQPGSPKRRSERQDMNSPSLSPQPKSRIRSEPVSFSLSLPSSSSTSHSSTMEANINSSLAANGMLPTPAKTPRKKQIEDFGSTARTLFSSSSKSNEDSAAMMPKRSRSKKYSGFSLESFEADPQQASQQPISIFTDSRDRIPQVNNNPDNPFRSKPADGEPSSSKVSADAGRRRKLDESSRKRDKKVDKAIHRDDGLLYVFRGKKVFRKFKPEVEEEEGDDDDLGLLASRSELTTESIPRIRPLTRSSIKPRVLFPEATATPAVREEKKEPSTPSTIFEEEEEQTEEPAEESAETVDQPAIGHAEVESDNPITPQGQITQLDTPSSPLASGRSLRSHALKTGSEPEAEHRDPETPTAKRFSPFDRWRRGKSHSTPTKTKKRGIDGNSNPASKKSRSH